MTDNVVKFNGLTKKDLAPESILRAIADKKPDECIIIAIKDDRSDLYGSMADLQRVLWLIKKMEHDILSGRFD